SLSLSLPQPVALSRIPDGAVPEQVLSRFRREILPSEGEMYASNPGDPGLGPGLYPQALGIPSGLAQLSLSPGELQQLERQALSLGLRPGTSRPGPGTLGRALQRPLGAGDPREQAEAYAAGLLRAWEQLGRNAAYARPRPRGGYLDHNGPRLGEQEEGEAEEEGEEGEDGARETEERLLVYLVGRILEDLGARGDQPAPRGPSRGRPEPRRLRRALEGAGGSRASLLRVKRVGAE
ncbi:hypothetical protein chiPu_0027515, partial [Chiloscyllium punctatum]|nr:hypothetical protein [Chiloscyllium punctatum]